MGARQVVLQTLPKSSHPRPLLSRQHRAAVSPLAATLMDFPASFANKSLTVNLTPLDATLTKNKGVVSFQSSEGFLPSGRSDVKTFGRLDIFWVRVFNGLHTLPSYVSCKSFACHSYENCRVYTKASHSGTRSASARRPFNSRASHPSNLQTFQRRAFASRPGRSVPTLRLLDSSTLELCDYSTLSMRGLRP